MYNINFDVKYYSGIIVHHDAQMSEHNIYILNISRMYLIYVIKHT